MQSTNFNPNTAMNTMMMTNHIMSHFNTINKNSTIYDTLTDKAFISETTIMFIQIIAISIFTALINDISVIFKKINKIVSITFKKYIIGFILKPFVLLYNYLYKLIIRDIPKYKISRNISLITSEYKKNSELLEIIQWYISSDYCKKGKRPENIVSDQVKEIYYSLSNISRLSEYDDTNKSKINFNVSPLIDEDFIIQYEGYDIVCYKSKTQIEVNADVETHKRDNITYFLETYDTTENSTIIENFCEHAIRIFNSNRVEWKQQIYRNKGRSWDEPSDFMSPTNVDAVILKNDIKDEFVNSLNFFHDNKDFYRNHGQRYKYVTVFMGPPGTGKTTLALAYSNQRKRHIYALDLNQSYEGELKDLIDKMDTNKGDLLIDDFDHYFSDIGNTEVKKEEKKEKKENKIESDNFDDDDDSFDNDSHSNKYKGRRNNKQKEKISYHELLTILDGTNTKDGLNIYIIINDPSKLFKSTNIEDLALFRDRRVNKMLEFKYCDHMMISGIYKNIFGTEPDMELVKQIKEDYYAPCVIAQQFISFCEKYGGDVKSKQDEINTILINLINNTIDTNQSKIISYIKTLKEYNKEKTL